MDPLNHPLDQNPHKAWTSHLGFDISVEDTLHNIKHAKEIFTAEIWPYIPLKNIKVDWDDEMPNI